MIVQKDFLNKLRDFGLNTYESKLWTALLSRGISTAGELSDIAGVPRSRSYDVLESLEKKGFIVMKLGKPIKYIAVPPEEVIERVKKKVREDSEGQLRLIEELRTGDILDELALLHKQGVELVEPTDFSGSIRGRNNLNNHLETMLRGAKKSIVLMTTDKGIVRKADILKNTLAKAKQKGIKVRIATQVTKENIDILKNLVRLADIRQSSAVKARFCVVDGREFTFMLLDDKDVHPTYDVAIWVNTEFFAKAIEDMFESEWKKMKPIDQSIKAA